MNPAKDGSTTSGRDGVRCSSTDYDVAKLLQPATRRMNSLLLPSFLGVVLYVVL